MIEDYTSISICRIYNQNRLFSDTPLPSFLYLAKMLMEQRLQATKHCGKMLVT
jgi:hypothetical protein